MAPYDQFLLFGDSLTQQSSNQDGGFCFAAALQDAYIRRLDVINRGFSAYNTREVLKLLPHIIPSPEQAKLRFVTVFFGANDACLPGTSSGQHIPLSEYRHNLVQILRHPSLAAHNARIILITPPPINEYQLESGENEYSIGRRRTVEHTKLYADAARQVGEDLQIVTLDLWEALIRKTKWDPSQTIPGSKAIKESPILREHLRDGLHFNPAAYRVLFDELMNTIRREWPDQAPDQLPFVVPAWDDLRR